MKYCINCGHQIPDNANHCPECGAPQKKRTDSYENNLPPLPIRKNNLPIALIIALVLGAAAILAIVLVLVYNNFSTNNNEEITTSHKSTITIVQESPAKASSSKTPTKKTRFAGNLLPLQEGGTLTEMYLGEGWRSANSSLLINAINLKGGGTVGKGRVNIDAALLPDGRIIGRNYHSAGFKLDVNGLLDSSGDITIQLGHGADTSWYYLSPAGRSGDTFYYRGTWTSGSTSANVSWALTTS